MILYFSATGNGKYCAEFLASKLGDTTQSLNDMMKNNVRVLDCSGCERIGIVAPTYDMDLAYSVADFLEALEFQNVPENCYIFGIFTCGASCANCGETLKKILAKKNLTLSAGFVVVMPDNYVPMFKQKSDAEKKIMLDNANKTLQEITKDIAENKRVFKVNGIQSRIVNFFMHKFAIPYQKKIKGFSVNDNCIGCGLCEKICPMNIIIMKDGRPTWTKDNCACCLGCLHRCPKGAINRGNSAKNGRYVNPNVKM